MLNKFPRMPLCGVESEVALTRSGKYCSPSTLTLSEYEFQPNGSRVYVDGRVGSDFGGRDRFEIATAECANPLQLVAVARATMLNELENLRISNPRKRSPIEMVVNNIDTEGNSWGTHENYLCTQSSFAKKILMAPHLATRILYTGSGFLNDNNSYSFSGRIPFINELQNICTTHAMESSRSLVNARDEPHSNYGRWKRLHVISEASNNLTIANFLKFGTTAVILMLIEDNALPFVSLNPNDCITFAHDLNKEAQNLIHQKFSSSIQLAIKIQRTYLHAAIEHYKDEDSKWFKMLISEWGNVLTNLEKDPTSLIGSLDWISKYYYWKIISDEQNRDLNDTFWQAELTYSMLTDEPLEAIFKADKFRSPTLSADTIDKYKTMPPSATRASARGKAIKTILENPALKIKKIDWERLIVIGEHGSRTLNLPNPTNPYSIKFGKFEERIKDLE